MQKAILFIYDAILVVVVIAGIIVGGTRRKKVPARFSVRLQVNGEPCRL